MNIVERQGDSFETTELVEHEQKMIAGSFVMTVADAYLVFVMVGLTLKSLSSATPLGRQRV